MHAHIAQRQAGQSAYAALGKDHIAVPFGIDHAALVAEHGREGLGQEEGVGGLLREPPGVLAAIAVVVVAVPDPVHGGGVDGVAPHVLQRAVIGAVSADFGMAVKFATQDLPLSARDLAAVAADGGQFGALGLRALAGGRIVQRGLGAGLEQGGLHGIRGMQAAEVHVVVKGVLAGIQRGVAAFAAGSLGAVKLGHAVHAVVAAVGYKEHLGSGGQRGEVVHQVVAVRNADGAHPLVSLQVGGHAAPGASQRAAEAVEPSARNEPDAPFGVADDAAQVVVGLRTSHCRVSPRRATTYSGLFKGEAIRHLGGGGWRRSTHIRTTAFSFALPLSFGACLIGHGTGQGIGDISSRFLPGLAIPHGDADLAVAIQGDAVGAVVRPPVLAPGGTALFVGHPHAAFVVIRHSGTGLILRGVGHRHGLEGAVAIRLQDAHPDVVVALFIGVPGQGQLAAATQARIGGDGGIPAVSAAVGNRLHRSPGPHFICAGADLKLPLVRRHPGQHQRVLGGVGDHRVQVIARRLGEILHRAELAVGKVTGENFKIALQALAPHDPRTALAVHRHGGLVDVAPGLGDGDTLFLPLFHLAHMQPELVAADGRIQKGEILRLLFPALGTLIAVDAWGEALIDEEAVPVRPHGHGGEVIVRALLRHLAQIESGLLHGDAALHEIQRLARLHIREFEAHLSLRGSHLHAALRGDVPQLHIDAVFKDGSQLLRHLADLLGVVPPRLVWPSTHRRAAAGLPGVFAGQGVLLLKAVAVHLQHLPRRHSDGAVPHGGLLVIEPQMDQQRGVCGRGDAGEQKKGKQEMFHG